MKCRTVKLVLNSSSPFSGFCDAEQDITQSLSYQLNGNNHNSEDLGEKISTK